MRRKHSEHPRTSRLPHIDERNPLLRRSDRVQATAKNTVLTLLILMLPIAVWIGMATLASQNGRVAAQQHTVHQVTATTTADADATPVMQSEFTSTANTTVDATWTVDGVDHVGSVSLTSGSPAGTQLPIWVDGSGDRTTTPTTHADAVAASLFTGIGSLFAVAMILIGAYLALRFRLDSRRHDQWDRQIKAFFDENSLS